ncbi:MAG: HlyD family efflux transporter periplasmic adaptor subunit [Verrucomicrobia bacterium]|nr:HlyD family efflux transporter periplasmic adaptor subunit [Verrucomicrobiota bacterium]
MSTPLRSPSAFEEPSGLLPADPPARAARWVGWLLLLLALVAGAFAVAIRLPETVTAPFLLVPAEGEDPVQAPVAGELAAIEARDGQEVKAGAELFRLRSDEIRNARARERQLAEDLRALAERARRLDEAQVALLAIKDAEVVQAERELGFREKHLETVRDLVRRSERLAAAGSVSPVELLARQLDEAESLKNRVVAEKAVQQLAFQRQELVAARARVRSDEQAEAEKLRVQIAALEEQLQGTTGDLKSVRAPYDAVILRVTQRTPGGVVAAGAELCHLARPDSRPRARLVLPEAALPRLAVGQRVRLFLDSHPYQRYGTIPAEIAWISPAPVTMGAERRFIALADLATTPPGGVRVRVGMGGEARVHVGRQTLLEQALEPLRGLRERLKSE